MEILFIDIFNKVEIFIQFFLYKLSKNLMDIYDQKKLDIFGREWVLFVMKPVFL